MVNDQSEQSLPPGMFKFLPIAQTVDEPASPSMSLYQGKRDCAADVNVSDICWSQWICFCLNVKQKEECTKKIRELGSLPADAFEKHQKTPVKTVSSK